MATENAPVSPVEQKEKKSISSIKTAKGSVYRYLSDGRTQRYKEATGELMEPTDILVFIPPWDSIKQRAKELYPQAFGETGGEFQYEQDLLEYAQNSGKTIRIHSNRGGSVLKSMDEVNASEQPLLYFITKDDGHGRERVDFTLPAAKAPRVGWYTFDDRRWKGEDGLQYHEKHMGNKVAEINYEN